jgi:hypothetical protein
MRFKHIDIQANDRIHMTDEPQLTFKNRSIDDNSMSGVGKPAGLWYAMGRAWLEWMESEGMNWWKKYLYKIEINPEKVLLLDTRFDVELFSHNYTHVPKQSFLNQINWGAVAKEYSGIEFNPYFYDLRLKAGFSFYYGIDIPSGCIWDKSGIKNITRLN